MPVLAGPARFAAINDSAFTPIADESPIIELKNQWIEDYQEIIATIPEDRLAAFRDAKSLLSDISSFSKNKSSSETVVTRSILDLRWSIMMMTLSLAIDVGDYPFAIDTVLKNFDSEDASLLNYLAKALAEQEGTSPGALRLVYQMMSEAAPKGSSLAKRKLYTFLESIGDYQAISDDIISADLFHKSTCAVGTTVYTPKLPTELPHVAEAQVIPARSVVLHDRTWSALLAKLATLYDDDSEVMLNQPIKISISSASGQEDVVSQLTQTLNTLAMSISRRPSIEDLAAGGTRTSKRRTATPATGGSKKSRSQQYSEIDIEGFLRGHFMVTDKTIEQIRGLVARGLSGPNQSDAIPGDFIDIQKDIFPTLAQWIMHSLSYFEQNVVSSPKAAGDFLLVTEGHLVPIPQCYALLAAKPDDYKEQILILLSRNESILSLSEESASLAFLQNYLFIRSFLAADDMESLHYLELCLASGPVEGPTGWFGFELSQQVLQNKVNLIHYKQKLAVINESSTDPAWFQVELFNGVSLDEPSACLCSIPSDLHPQLILAVTRSLVCARSFDRATKWLFFGFELASEELDFDFIRDLSSELLELVKARQLQIKDVPEVIKVLFVGFNFMIQNGIGADERRLVHHSMVFLWESFVRMSDKQETLIEFSWKYLAIDSIDKCNQAELLKNYYDLLSAPSRLSWNLLRVINGVKQYFPGDHTCDDIEASATLDLTKTSNRSFEKLYKPVELLESLLCMIGQDDGEDISKALELLDFLCSGLEKRLSPVHRTNSSILIRAFEEPINWNCPLPIHLYSTCDEDKVIASGFLEKARINQDCNSSKKKKSPELLRSWRADLIIGLAALPNRTHWTELAKLSYEAITLSLGSNFYLILDDKAELLKDLKILLIALPQSDMDSDERALHYSELFLLLSSGPLKCLLEEKEDLALGFDLSRAFLGSIKLKGTSDPIVYHAVVQALKGHPTQQLEILRMLMKNLMSEDPFEIRYEAAMKVLAKPVLDVEFMRQELIRLNLIQPSDSVAEPNAMVVSWLEEIGAQDKKQCQHRHVFLTCILEPSLANWSRIFPFLTKPKSPIFANIWHCDQDLPGMHLTYKHQYLLDLLNWLVALPSCGVPDPLDLITMVCKKVCANLVDIADGDGLLTKTLGLLIDYKAKRPDIELKALVNLMAKSGDIPAGLVQMFKSPI